MTMNFWLVVILLVGLIMRNCEEIQIMVCAFFFNIIVRLKKDFTPLIVN